MVIDRADVLGDLQARFDCPVGRRRELSIYAYLLSCATVAILGTDQHITQHWEALFQLNRSTQRRLGLMDARGRDEVNYDQFDYLFNVLTKGLRDGWCARHPALWRRAQSGQCQRGCGAEHWRDTQWFMDRLVDGSQPIDIDLGSSLALDSTDFETHARRVSWNPRPDVELDDLNPYERSPHVRQRRGRPAVNPHGWPKKGSDGRWQHSWDSDAREGWRAGKNGRPSETFLGYDFHTANATRPRDRRQAVPPIIRGAKLVPAGAHKGLAGADVVEGIVLRGTPVTDVVADRAYTTVYPENFHYRVRKTGADLVLDLHPNQRGTLAITDGVIAVDGTFFPDWLPEQMRFLPAISPFDPPGRRLAAREKYDSRAAFAFRRNRTYPDGREQWIGPAAGSRPTARCVNWTRSMRAARKLPRTPCRPGDSCACGRCITFGVDVIPRIRQREPWNTTAWQDDYGRRPMVETGNSILKHHFLKLQRHFTRVCGLHKNAFLLAFAIVGANVNMADSFRRVQQLADPWGDGTVSAPTKPSKRGRRSGRASGYADLPAPSKDP